jgi:hypothetical protein
MTKGPNRAVRQQAMSWIIEHLASSFCAGEPQEVTTEKAWRVPVLLAYPFMIVGEVGEFCWPAHNSSPVSSTPCLQAFSELRSAHRQFKWFISRLWS